MLKTTVADVVKSDRENDVVAAMIEKCPTLKEDVTERLSKALVLEMAIADATKSDGENDGVAAMIEKYLA